MELTPYLIAKLALWPVVLVVFLAAARWLPSEHPIRRFLDLHGIPKTAAYATLSVFAIGGIWLTVAYS